jgi:HD-GYP domain-containing protein (c-di-GMP phosphodiesterase class II)
VAALAAAAGEEHGLPADDVSELRRAGWVHDLGRLGVSNQVWDKKEPLTRADLERIHMHPYLGERILSRVPGLKGEAALAGSHHERVDGSGYPRGIGGTELGVKQRILAAADSYRASLEPRPHRPALTPRMRLPGCGGKSQPAGSAPRLRTPCSSRPASSHTAHLSLRPGSRPGKWKSSACCAAE